MIQLEHLDVNIITGCNKTCVSCSHASPYTKSEQMTVDQMVHDLLRLEPIVHFEQVTLVGGEPLLHPRLLEFVTAAEESGICDQVCIVTNGTLLPRMKEVFWEQLQVLRLSIYPDLDRSIVTLAQEKSAQYGFTLQAWEYNEFYKQLKPRADDGKESFRNCKWKSDCYTVHNGFFHLCPQSIFFPKRFMGGDAHDGLSLEGITGDKLQAYLERTEPFQACRICAADQLVLAPWKEAKKSEWEKESTL